jgi:hypothetical protein
MEMSKDSRQAHKNAKTIQACSHTYPSKIGIDEDGAAFGLLMWSGVECDEVHD